MSKWLDHLVYRTFVASSFDWITCSLSLMLFFLFLSFSSPLFRLPLCAGAFILHLCARAIRAGILEFQLFCRCKAYLSSAWLWLKYKWLFEIGIAKRWTKFCAKVKIQFQHSFFFFILWFPILVHRPQQQQPKWEKKIKECETRRWRRKQTHSHTHKKKTYTILLSILNFWVGNFQMVSTWSMF